MAAGVDSAQMTKPPTARSGIVRRTHHQRLMPRILSSAFLFSVFAVRSWTCIIASDIDSIVTGDAPVIDPVVARLDGMEVDRYGSPIQRRSGLEEVLVAVA
jgi:hypothetical protein